MKIYEFSPFYNENTISKIKLDEASSWINKLTIKECDYTYTKKFKGFVLDETIINNELVNYVPLNGKKIFKKSGFGLVRKFPFIGYKNRSWYNEAIQREFAKEINNLNINEEDILIFSDIDEILDSRYADEIIDLVNHHGIITVKLHFSLFYFNLLSKNWGGPSDYSYRVFIMTGEHYKKLDITLDELRKRGERGLLFDTIYCPKKIYGFHHSWLGDESFIFNKLKSYCHMPNEHDSSILTNGEYDMEKIKVALKNNKSIFPGHELYVSNNITLLSSIESNPELNKYIL